MAGIMIDPMAAVSAAAEPDTPEKIAADTIDTCASPPRTCPTRAFAKLTIFCVSPPSDMRLPART